MRKIFLSGCIFLSMYMTAHAQQKWGIVGGAGLSKITGYNVSGAQTDFLVVLQGSVFTTLPLAKNSAFVLKPSVGYVPKGVSFKNVLLTNLDGSDIGYGNLKRRLDYIQLTLPVNYKMKWKQVTAYLGAGPYFSYAVSGREVRDTRLSQIYAREKIFAKVDFKGQSISRFDAGINIQFTTVFSNNWCAGINADMGLTKINTAGTVSTRNQYAGVYFGYTF